MTTAVEAPKTRNAWNQPDLVLLIQQHTEGRPLAVPGKTEADCRRKLLAFGLVKKEPKIELPQHVRDSLDEYARRLAVMGEPHRTLALRYGIKSLQSFLPKKTAKAE